MRTQACRLGFVALALDVNFEFYSTVFETIMGGLSAIDLPRLQIETLEHAHSFIRTYGYDPSLPQEMEKIWSYHRRAVTLLREEILEVGESIPEHFCDHHQLEDPGYLLVAASKTENMEEQRWACAILRVMHVFAHTDNDIFFAFSDQIQEQILKPFRDAILNDGATGLTLGRQNQIDQIHLARFDVKPFKANSSSVVKLLTKPQAVALNLLDKVGVRFVTRDIFDSFRVIRFLAQENIVSYPNVMPDQSRNTLYPVNLFFEVLEEYKGKETSREILQKALLDKIGTESHRAEFKFRQNNFSGADFKAVKFICRALIKLDAGPRPLTFFFPYEIQIVDQANYQLHLTGKSSHDEYKKRQRQVARERILHGNATQHLPVKAF